MSVKIAHFLALEDKSIKSDKDTLFKRTNKAGTLLASNDIGFTDTYGSHAHIIGDYIYLKSRNDEPLYKVDKNTLEVVDQSAEDFSWIRAGNFIEDGYYFYILSFNQVIKVFKSDLSVVNTVSSARSAPSQYVQDYYFMTETADHIIVGGSPITSDVDHHASINIYNKSDLSEITASPINLDTSYTTHAVVGPDYIYVATYTTLYKLDKDTYNVVDSKTYDYYTTNVTTTTFELKISYGSPTPELIEHGDYIYYFNGNDVLYAKIRKSDLVLVDYVFDHQDEAEGLPDPAPQNTSQKKIVGNTLYYTYSSGLYRLDLDNPYDNERLAIAGHWGDFDLEGNRFYGTTYKTSILNMVPIFDETYYIDKEGTKYVKK